MDEERYVSEHPNGDRNTLNKYCLGEIEKNLRNIENYLNNFNNNQNDDQSLLNILNTCQTIEDLAMVYGYEGVESLALNLSAAIASIVTKEQKIPDNFLEKLGIVIKAMRSMSGIDDTNKVHSIVDNIIQKIKTEDQQPTPDNDFEDLIHFQTKSSEDAIEFQQNSEPPQQSFDINEMNSIADLIQKIKKNNELAENNKNKKEQPAKFQANLTSTINSKKKEQVKELEQVFNDIFVEETIENLNFLINSIELAKKGESLGESIMRIKEACGSLKDSANCFNIAPVQEPVALLYQLAREKLSFNKQPSPNILDVIAEAEQAIRNFIDHNNSNFAQLNDKIKQVLSLSDDAVTNTEKEISLNKPCEGEIKIVDNIPFVRETLKKKKVKVIFKDDDVDRRWISKFK